ncbi:uncharacterized protein LOC116215156 [Punica granatum]|uniref:Uncharacterized protein n=2 Tax=Punica granatum TaxID=22663 RepID=A0A218XVI0_PUNGR|nr:uncharacterized protein LOC116215156 [Punica granatum]OWM88646.1 hypothetical protein CDL15_Pgr002413 [Punica granatum]PKI37651.1 hypothetical protein CRG98_041944 [Punica granatum]
MAGILSLKRSLLTANLKLLIRDSSSYAHHTGKVITATAAASFSTAFERAQGSNAVEESMDSSGGPAVTPGTSNNDPTRQGTYEAKQEALDVDQDRASGVTGFMAEKVRDGAEKAKEMTDRVGETAKKTIDGARKAAAETTQPIKEAVTRDDEDEKRGPNQNVDSWDYRNIVDLRQRAGGYDTGAP